MDRGQGRESTGGLREADHALYERLTSLRSPALDGFFSAASRAADFSVLWLCVAAALALVGGRRGRQAALTGSIAVGLSAALANGPLKLVWPRARPDQPEGLQPRVRRPRTLSFPSAHSSAAFAFVTAVGTEVPALMLPLGAVAAVVAYSRVYNRVHYPSDVLAGSLLGALIGCCTSRLRRGI